MAEGFRSLKAWQRAYSLALEIYRITRAFPKAELYGLTAQIRRAAISVPANIAEGYETQHRREYVQFLTIAKGSLAEVETYLELRKDVGYLDEPSFQTLDSGRQEVGRLLRGLLNSLK